jgi:glutamate formiminotransferase/formiminotetrahydrofolate cyclodeaminase
MPEQMIECIPNFSEARKPEVVKAILDSIQAVSKITILDVHSDNDHNRTVVTYIGPPQEVEEAAFLAIKTAAELIDLDHHTGSHPRLGATDVVPFIPISGADINDCVKIARHLAQRVGRDLLIPVYLYEQAALDPKRIKLERIRKGEYELLKQEIRTNLDRKPDFGPSMMTPAGATIIGARNPLIAFNVYLASNDIQAAKTIARSIRESSGGLPSVKALGMLVDGLAQVSMNLTNYKQTSLLQVFNAIETLAGKQHLNIHHSELVGLIPREALMESAIGHLRLDGFKEDQVLEHRLLEVGTGLNNKSFAILDDFASEKPTPGGGSAAAFSGALAAALVSMVTRLTIGKKRYASVTPQMHEILLQSEKLRSLLTDSVKQDSKAFEEVMSAFKLPKETSEQEQIRMEAIESSTRMAAQVPMQVAHWSALVLALSERVANLGNITAISDAGSAGVLAMASVKAALFNVRINLMNLTDEVTVASMQNEIDQLEKRTSSTEAQLTKILKERGSI